MSLKVGLCGRARCQARAERLKAEEDEGGEREALDLFGAQVAAIQATGVDTQHSALNTQPHGG